MRIKRNNKEKSVINYISPLDNLPDSNALMLAKTLEHFLLKNINDSISITELRVLQIYEYSLKCEELNK